MTIPVLTEEDIRRIFNEELDKRFGPAPSKRVTTSDAAREEEDLICTKEACRILACCERTLQRYRASRLVTVIYRGPHRCYYYRSEIVALRDANTRPNRDNS